MSETVVQKQLVCLEDIALGAGAISQVRGGVTYTLNRVDLVPSVDSVADLPYIEGYERARVGLVNYKKTLAGWVVDPIPLTAFAALGSAASRNATGPGDVLHKGFAGIGGAAGSGATGLTLGLQASVALSTAEGGPVDEECAILTLPGTTSNAAQLAISASGALFVRRVGATWAKVALTGASVDFAAVKATSVRADSVGTPKD